MKYRVGDFIAYTAYSLYGSPVILLFIEGVTYARLNNPDYYNIIYVDANDFGLGYSHPVHRTVDASSLDQHREIEVLPNPMSGVPFLYVTEGCKPTCTCPIVMLMSLGCKCGGI